MSRTDQGGVAKVIVSESDGASKKFGTLKLKEQVWKHKLFANGPSTGMEF